MRFLIILLFISFSFPCIAQNNELLRSRGTLPRNIVGTSTQQVRYELDRIGAPAGSTPADQLTLVNRTVNLCQAIALSGRLMINDTMSAYANRILDILLKDDTTLRRKLCVYFYYSEGTNAVTLYNGMIIIEMGLMAHVKNEAQLAFILSHEICHYREDHFLKYLRYTQKTENATDPLTTVLRYSREQEQEADSLGFIIYKKSGYAISEAIAVFDMLRTSDMAEEQVPFSPALFEEGSYTFPLDYRQDTLLDVYKEIIDETLSTHPSCESRKLKMEALAAAAGTGEPYLISQPVFNLLRRIAREECCTLFLEDRDFGEAIYRAYALLSEDSTNVTARKIMGKALYNLAAYSLADQPVVIPNVFISYYDPEGIFDFEKQPPFKPLPDYEEIDGESQRMHYFLFNVNRAEFVILALKWNWTIYSQGNYHDELWSEMCSNLIRMLSAYYGQKAVNFPGLLKIKKREDEDAPHKPKTTQPNETSEPEKPMEEQYRGYCYHAFDKMSLDSVLALRFERLEDIGALPTEFPLTTLYEYNQQRHSGYGLNIKNMYLLPPAYYMLKKGKKDVNSFYDPLESAQLESQQQAAMVAAAKAVQQGFFLVTPERMNSARVNDYNTYCMLQQWMTEQNGHSSNALAINLAHAELADSLVQRLGTRYVMTSSIIAKKQKNTPKNASLLVTKVYDLKTGTIILVYANIAYTKPSYSQMAEYYTEVFAKIAKKKR